MEIRHEINLHAHATAHLEPRMLLFNCGAYCARLLYDHAISFHVIYIAPLSYSLALMTKSAEL